MHFNVFDLYSSPKVQAHEYPLFDAYAILRYLRFDNQDELFAERRVLPQPVVVRLGPDSATACAMHRANSVGGCFPLSQGILLAARLCAVRPARSPARQVQAPIMCLHGLIDAPQAQPRTPAPLIMHLNSFLGLAAVHGSARPVCLS